AEPTLHLVAHFESVATTARLAVIVCGPGVGASTHCVSAADAGGGHTSLLVAVLVPQVVAAVAVHTHDACGVPRPASESAVHTLAHAECLGRGVRLVDTLLIHAADATDHLRVNAPLVVPVVVV